MVKSADTESKGKFITKSKFKGGAGKGGFNKGNAGGIKFVKGERRRKPVDENTKNMRRLYNRLMQKPSQKQGQKETNKADIVKRIMKAVNENYGEICFKHDGCRVLQGCIKYGDKKQRHEIIKHLIPHIYDLITKKYSIYLAIKIFKFAEHSQREEILNKCIYPNFSKLMKNGNGQMFINFAFDNVTFSMQNHMIDYYIKHFLKISEDRLNLTDNKNNSNSKSDPTDPSNDVIIFEKQGTFDQENVRNDLKAHLEKQLEKGVHKTFIFQGFLNKVFDLMDSKTKAYITELFDDDTHEFLNNRHGIELSCKIFTVASAKTRKKIIKKLKDSVKTLLSNDLSVIYLIKVILFNDDTKLVEKYLLKSLVELMNEEIMQNKNLLKIFINIISPFNPRVNNQYENKTLQYKVDSSSKKDDNKRTEELISLVLEDIFRIVNLNNKFFVTDNLCSNLLLELIAYLKKHDSDGEKLKELLKNLLYLIEIDYKNNFDYLEATLLADKTSHFVINKLIKTILSDSSDLTESQVAFFKGLTGVLLNNLEGFLNTKAIFIVVTLVENEKTKKYIEKDLKKLKNLITEKSEEKDMIGFQLLNKSLNK